MSKVLTINHGLSQDGKTLSYIDATPIGTGGYGDTLPDRDTLALLNYIYYQPSDEEAGPVVLAPASHSPLDVVTFNVNVEGIVAVIFAHFFAVPLYTVGVLDDGDIVYNTNTNTLQKQILGVLTDIPVSDLVGDETVMYGSKNSKIDVEVSKLQNQYLLIVNEKLEAYLAHACEYHEYMLAQTNYNYIVNLRAAAHFNFCGGSYDVAQKNLETAWAFAKKALNIE